ncbi:hypothetical protein ACKI2N_006350 [Cupriavidus sp. 30B13]|uniref:hypothetical protein n=1 Tax=Cupriavidus sp. 30B13 TaxID=3384241 RepID=UPI003B8FAE5E
MGKVLHWFALCWLSLALAASSILLLPHWQIGGVFYFGAVVSGVMCFHELERRGKDGASWLFWYLVPSAIFLLPLALLALSVRIFRLRDEFQGARGDAAEGR